MSKAKKPAAKAVETKTYPDGVVATGTAPLPETSPVADTPIGIVGTDVRLDDAVVPVAAVRMPQLGEQVMFWPSAPLNADPKPSRAAVTTVWGPNCVNLDNGASSVTLVKGNEDDAYGYRFAYLDGDVDVDQVTARVLEHALDVQHAEVIAGRRLPLFSLEDAHKLPLAIDGQGECVAAASERAITSFAQGGAEYEVVHLRGHGLAKRRI
jgi:hypothetical protein